MKSIYQRSWLRHIVGSLYLFHLPTTYKKLYSNLVGYRTLVRIGRYYLMKKEG